MHFLMDYDPMLLEALSRLPYAPKTQCAEEQGPNTLAKPDGNWRITEQQHEGSDSGSPSKSPAGGTDQGANAKGSGVETKRKKRSQNWSDKETEILLKAVPRKKKTKSRFNRVCGSELRWEGVAKEVSGRAGHECQRRMETLTKSYRVIKEYCDNHKKEFSELTEKDFEEMKPKLATRLMESWYNHIRDHCPPRSNKKSRNQGAESSLANRVPVLPASTSGEVAEVHNPITEPTKVVMITPESITQIKPPLEASGVVRIGNKIDKTWDRRLGEHLIVNYRSKRRHGAGLVVWILSRCRFDS